MSKKIEIWFSNGSADISLGMCGNDAEIVAAVAEIKAAGSGDEDWSDWEAETYIDAAARTSR